MSVTNDTDGLAVLLVDKYGVHPDESIWIEHYPVGNDRPETYELIEFSWGQNTTSTGSWIASNPQWRRITLEEAEIATGANLIPSKKIGQ